MDGSSQSILEHLQAIYISDLTYRDFFIPGAFVLWSLLLTINLKMIDSDHHITAATFVLFCIAAGVLEIIALPSIFHEAFSMRLSLSLIALFMILATARWYRLSHQREARVAPNKVKDIVSGK